MGKKIKKSKTSSSLLERIAKANEESFGTKRLNYYNIYDFQSTDGRDAAIGETQSRKVKQLS